MGLLWIQRKWEEEGNDEQEREETIERYVLEISEVTDGKKDIREALIRRHGDVPPLVPYSPHPDNDLQQRIFVSGFRPTRQVPGANIWDLEITYSSEVNLPENPLDAPMEWEVDTDVQEEPSFRDADGKPYMTTSFELIEATNDIPHVVLSGSRAISTSWPDWLLTYGGAVNNDDVRIKGKTWPVGTLKCTKIKIGKDEETKEGVAFCALNLELTYNQKGWQLDTPNRGFFKLVPRPQDKGAKPLGPKANQQKYYRVKLMIENEHKLPEYPQEPQMLDAKGALIPVPTESNIVILTFNRNARLPFSALPLK